MSTEAIKLAEEVLALDSTATRAPWMHQPADENGNWRSIYVDDKEGAVVFTPSLYVMGRDVDLIAHYRTSAPILATALIESEKELRELKAWLSGPNAPLSLEDAMSLQKGRNAARVELVEEKHNVKFLQSLAEERLHKLAEARKRIAELEAQNPVDHLSTAPGVDIEFEEHP